MSLKFTGLPGIVPSFSTANDATQQFPLGQRATDELGNEWKYIQAGASGVVRGKVLMPLAKTAIAATMTTDTDKLVITKASAGWTPGLWSGRFIYIDAGTSEGDMRLIRKNSATTITVDTAITTTFTGTTTAEVFHPFICDLATASSQTLPVGVAGGSITSSYYGWAQVSGVAEVLAGDVMVAGVYAVLGDDTAGQVIPAANTNDMYDVTAIGIALTANASADVGCPIMLNI